MFGNKIKFQFSLQTRFLHDPTKAIGFVGSALSSNMVRFFKTSDESWNHEVIKVTHLDLHQEIILVLDHNVNNHCISFFHRL